MVKSRFATRSPRCRRRFSTRSKNFLAKVDNVTAKPIYGTMTINGDKAELKYTLSVSYMYRDSKAPGTAQFKYRATLARHKDGWEITELTVIP